MKKNILIIDDEKIFLELLGTYFEDQDYEVTTSLSGQNILKLLFGKSFDVVLVDVWMADKSGVEVLKEIKKVNPALPVVLMTGYTASSLESSLKGLDVAGFVTKPFKLFDLGALIEKVISGEADSLSGGSIQELSPILEKERYSILIADDDDHYRNSLVEMFKEHGISALAAPDGESALKLYMENKDVNILILDINMPRLNGIELLKKIRVENDKVTAIFITGLDNTELHAKLVEDRGAYAVYQKPLRYKHFLRFVEINEQIDLARKLQIVMEP
jgi:DNA-binding NtrC family response regulator